MVTAMSPRASAKAHAPTPLLAFIAGEFAGVVAQIWRPPYADFFALPASRRHALAILIAGMGRRHLGDFELRRLIVYGRDAAVAEAIAGPAATGLMKALGKAGERLWRRADYLTFLGLFLEPRGNEVLRHVAEIRPEKFATLAALPPPLRMRSIVDCLPDAGAAADLGLAFHLALRMREAGAEARLARRWSAGGGLAALFRRAQEDLTPDAFTPVAPPPRLGAPFVRILQRRDLERAAREFRNCLDDHAQRVAEGRLAVYLWRRDPAAAIALSWDVAGWRLAEAKLADNIDLAEPVLRDLVSVLEPLQVRTGPSVQALRSRLDDYCYGGTPRRPAGDTLLDRLELGDLWS